MIAPDSKPRPLGSGQTASERKIAIRNKRTMFFAIAVRP